MYFRCRVTWLLPFQNAHEFPSYSTSIFVLYEQVIINQVFNDEPCFPQAGTCPLQRQLAKSSAPCYQSSTTGKLSYDQQRKGTDTRKAKEVLWDAWRLPWWAQTLADVVLPCSFSHSALQGCTVMENHARCMLPGILSVIRAFDFAPFGDR